MTNPPDPIVSVIIPCHNAAAYLGETLDSVLAQTGPGLEIVLVDDGSTDESVAVAAGRGDPRIRILSIPASGGPSRPRNLAISEARGRYLFFCDADDVMRPGKIARQVEVLEAWPAVGLVYTDFAVIDSRGDVIDPSFLAGYRWHRRLQAAGPGPDGAFDRRLMVRALLHGNFIGTSGVAVRSEVLAEVGVFDETLASSEDLDLWLRIARSSGCAYVDLVGHGYRRHGASLMQERSARHPLARIEVLNRQWQMGPDADERRAIRRRLAKNECSLGYIHELNGDMAAARQHYRASLKHTVRFGALWGWLKAQTLGRVRGRGSGKGLAS